MQNKWKEIEYRNICLEETETLNASGPGTAGNSILKRDLNGKVILVFLNKWPISKDQIKGLPSHASQLLHIATIKLWTIRKKINVSFNKYIWERALAKVFVS